MLPSAAAIARPLACWLLALTPLLAHGGQYIPPPPLPPPPGPSGPSGGPPHRGPGDATPPGQARTPGAPGGPAPAPGPAQPGTGPAGPTTGTGGPASGGPPAPSGARGPTTGPRLELEPDATRWELWWELHKDPFLDLMNTVATPAVQTGSDEFFLGATARRGARDSLLPSSDDAVREVLPALARLLARTEQRDVVTAGMVAMAKIGRDHPDFRLGPSVFAPRLRSHDQEVRETAALVLGIAGLAGDGQIGLLADLARDGAAGRRACGRAEVDGRTRAFACYALGLFARGADSVAERFRAVAPLMELVRSTDLKHRDVESAAILALGLLAGEGRGTAALRALAVDALADRLGRRTGAGDEYAQAQAPVAIARLLDPAAPAADVWRARFADELQDRRRGIVMAQSCALALGALCRPCADDRAPDAPTCAALLRTWREHADAQTRNFAIMGLGRSGGAHQRTLLLAQLDAAGKATELPWVALALGVHAFGHRRAGTIDHAVAAALRERLQRARNPEALGALAIAVGLCGDPAVADDLRLMLLEKTDETLAGHFCIGLALLGDRAVVPDLQGVLRSAARRPVLLQKAAIGLGMLGDKSVADELLVMMRGGEQSLARLSAIAVALGFIGDRRTLGPLLQLCDDDSLTALTRAFGVAALGGVCDRHRLPWNTDLRDFANYRATVDTLWDGSAGVLDIL